MIACCPRGRRRAGGGRLIRVFHIEGWRGECHALAGAKLAVEISVVPVASVNSDINGEPFERLRLDNEFPWIPRRRNSQ